MSQAMQGTPDRTVKADPTVTAHTRRVFLPRTDRSGVALCLSGGGSRAALFELGVLRRLNEVAILSHVDTISCVSGGSMLGAHLAERMDPWPDQGEVFPDFEGTVAAPFEDFVRRNLRTAPLARRYLVPWNWFRETTAIDMVVQLFERYLTRRQMASLPPRPRFIFNASDIAFGEDWQMSSDRMGNASAGWTSDIDWSVARAVAASACLPPLFHPMPIGLQPTDLSGGEYPDGARRDALIRGLRLSDGGLTDNLGIEPVWRDHRVVICADGGATFQVRPDPGLRWPRPSTVARRIGRYVGILGRQVVETRKRWLIASLAQGSIEGAYIGIGSKVASYEGAGPGYERDFVDDVISKVRSDLDGFDSAEIGVLQNHGYLVAEAATARHLAATLPLRSAPIAIPYPGLMDEARARTGLKDSGKRRLLGRSRWLHYLFQPRA